MTNKRTISFFIEFRPEYRPSSPARLRQPVLAHKTFKEYIRRDRVKQKTGGYPPFYVLFIFVVFLIAVKYTVLFNCYSEDPSLYLCPCKDLELHASESYFAK